jgi:hypothetical protein
LPLRIIQQLFVEAVDRFLEDAADSLARVPTI